MSLFPNIFEPLPFSSLYGEYVVRFSLPGGVFFPCGHFVEDKMVLYGFSEIVFKEKSERI